ncbi:hypothetical protein CDD81_853 [Ophiocordyceps australis]|uniref:Cytochrome P450 n=1 Tax=Ophiocordyceps australis TaxID=1399860 RepID=A0A2C5Y2C5_9HYPO|nr:hypothetical protein CDD81_853 [Ophiocordyceps australis]
MSLVLLLECVAIALLSYLAYRHGRFFSKPAGLGLPPGPRGIPLVGSIMDLAPRGVPDFLHWLKHKDSFGPVSSLTVMGQTLIICHDKEAANEILHKNSAKTAARPAMGCAQRLCGFDRLMPFQQYDQAHRQARKMMYQQFGTRALASQFDHVQKMEARRFLLRLLQTPDDWMQHLQTMTAAIMLNMTYGYSIELDKVDRLVQKVEEMGANVTAAFVPLTWATDIIPALEYLPEGFPGTGFRKTARRHRKTAQEVVDTPYDFVQREMKQQRNRASFVSKLLQQSGDEPDEDLIKWTATTLYAAGSETTVSTLSAFILAMVNFPEVQRKAQAEIDAIVSTGSFPRIEDREKMPYIEAIIKEVYRWSPVAPMGVPHALEQDVVFHEYLLPRGAYVLPAMWWFCHDPAVYADPDAFCPERYLEPRKEPDILDFAFGYGRRICPGRYFADAGVWTSITQMLTVLDISKAVDAQGVEVEAKLEYSVSLSGRPKKFACRILPRSAKHEEMICMAETEYPWEKSHGDLLNWTG